MGTTMRALDVITRESAAAMTVDRLKDVVKGKHIVWRIRPSLIEVRSDEHNIWPPEHEGKWLVRLRMAIQ